MDYRGWQINDMKKPMLQNTSDALQAYIQKHGLPEQILLEYSDQLEELLLPEGMSIVTKAVRIPKNILLIGDLHEHIHTSNAEVEN